MAALALGFFDGGIAALDPFDGAAFSDPFRFLFGSAPAAVPCLAWETSYDGGCCPGYQKIRILQGDSSGRGPGLAWVKLTLI